MVIFDQLRISDNGSQLLLNVHVNKAAYFDNIELARVVIQTSDQVSETDPLTPGDSYIYNLQVESGIRELNLVLDANTDFDKVWADSDRDYWMTAQEAKEYGMIDQVLAKKQ